MAKCEGTSLTLTVKKGSAKGANKDDAQLALAGKLIATAKSKKDFACTGLECDHAHECIATVDFVDGDALRFRAAKLPNKPPAKGFTMGWRCSCTGKAIIECGAATT